MHVLKISWIICTSMMSHHIAIPYWLHFGVLIFLYPPVSRYHISDTVSTGCGAMSKCIRTTAEQALQNWTLRDEIVSKQEVSSLFGTFCLEDGSGKVVIDSQKHWIMWSMSSMTWKGLFLCQRWSPRYASTDDAFCSDNWLEYFLFCRFHQIMTRMNQ